MMISNSSGHAAPTEAPRQLWYYQGPPSSAAAGARDRRAGSVPTVSTTRPRRECSAASAQIRKGSTTTAGGTGGMFGSHGGQQQQAERIVSSNIVSESLIGPMPQEERVQFVEIPVIEELVRHVPKKQIVEIEKRVPKVEYEFVERVVEVPQIYTTEKHVEVPRIQEVIRHVPVTQVVEVPKEVIRYVPKIENKIVEREVEVPGEVVEVPKTYLVERKVIVPRFADKEIPVVVAQRLVPEISESDSEFVDVELKEYNPYLVPVDVFVPRAVSRQLYAESRKDEHRVVDIPAGQFNALVRQLNSHFNESDFQDLLGGRDIRNDLYRRAPDGSIPMLQIPHGATALVPPVNNDWQQQVGPTQQRCPP